MDAEHLPYPWERQPGENPKAFASFVAYRGLPAMQRSIQRVSSDLSLDNRMLQRWSAKHQWVDRAAAWDDEQDRVRREAAMQQIVKMSDKHALLASNHLAILSRPAIALLKRMESGDIDFDVMPTKDLFEFIVQASRVLPGVVGVERISRGVSTEQLSFQAAGDKPTQVVSEASFQDDLEWTAQAIQKLRESGKLPKEDDES